MRSKSSRVNRGDKTAILFFDLTLLRPQNFSPQSKIKQLSCFSKQICFISSRKINKLGGGPN